MINYTNYNVSSTINKTTVRNKIKNGLYTFFKIDNYLVNNDLHEQSISHRLSIYLEELFPEYNVDCEWNKNISNQKRIFTNLIKKDVEIELDKIINEESVNKNNSKERYIKELNKLKEMLSENDKTKIKKVSDFSGDELLVLKDLEDEDSIIVKNIRPDIIIHSRGTKCNQVVIEIKKELNHSQYNSLRYYDLIKLHLLTTQSNLKYKFGYYIEIPIKNNSWKEIIISESKFLKNIFGTTNVFEVEFI